MMRVTTTLFLILLPYFAVQAQDESAGEEQEVRRYTIEIIIFKYAQDVSAGNEIFPGDEPTLEEQRFEDEIPLIADAPIDEPRRIRDIELVRLNREDFTMGEIMSRLRRLDAYEPLMHFGWTQATWPEEETLAIELGSLAKRPSSLDGSLTLYLSRFLHLVVDLQLDAPEAIDRDAVREDSVPSYGDYRARSRPGAIRYRIEENRILKSGELRYFDHPKFGVLAKVARVEEEPENLPEMDDTELLGYPAE